MTEGEAHLLTHPNMRFLEFVSCLGLPMQTAAVSADPRPREETRALVPLSCTAGETPTDKKRRRRSSGAWRPSLVAISEDSIPVPTGKGDRTVGSVKRSEGKGRSTAKISARDDRNLVGNSGVPVVFPAFSPTAFLF